MTLSLPAPLGPTTRTSVPMAGGDTGKSAEHAAEALRGGVDEDHRGEDDDDHGTSLRKLEGPHHLPDDEPDAAGADQPDHRGGADIRFEAIEGIGDPQRHDLGDDAVDDLLEEIGAGRANALDRMRIDRLDRLGEELGEDAGGVDEESQHPREGTELDRGDE